MLNHFMFVEHCESIINLDKDEAIEFFSGYMVANRERFSKCPNCVRTLIASDEDEMSVYFQARDEFKVLWKPSGALVALIEVTLNLELKEFELIFYTFSLFVLDS